MKSIVLLLVVLFGCGGEPPPDPPTDVPAPEVVNLTPARRETAGIVTQPIEVVTRTEALEAPAVLALDETRTARIGSYVDGLVVQTLADVGQAVDAGAVLAWIYGDVVHDAWADYRKALAERRRLASELTFSRAAEERAVRLLGEKAIARQELERARADRVAAAEQLDVASAELHRAEEVLRHLGIAGGEAAHGERGEQIPVRAPFGGIVIARDVGPGSAVTPGTRMFVVSDLRVLWAVAELDETQLADVALGDHVQLRVPAWPEDAFPGRVTMIADTVNPKTRRVSVRCEIPNPDRRLKAEMFARVALGSGPPRQQLLVPTDAVQDVGGADVVFVEDPADVFRPRRVTLGAEQDGRVEVRDGVRAGERVAVRGAFLLKSELEKGSRDDG